MPLGFGFGFLFEGSSGGDVVPIITGPRRVPTMLWINNTPLEWYGLQLQRADGVLDAPSIALPNVSRIPLLTGGRYEPMALSGPRDIVLTGIICDIPMEVWRPALRQLHDAMSGLLELRWAHSPHSVMYGVAGEPKTSHVQPDKMYVAPDRTAIQVTVTIRCVDSAIYEREPQRIRLSTTPKPIRLGSLSTGGVMQIDGPFSGDLNIDYLAPNGALLDRDALRDVDLDDGDVLYIYRDTPAGLVKLTPAGDLFDVYAWRSLSESTRWWSPSSVHGELSTDTYPLVRLSSGSGWWRYHIADAA